MTAQLKKSCFFWARFAATGPGHLAVLLGTNLCLTAAAWPKSDHAAGQ